MAFLFAFSRKAPFSKVVQEGEAEAHSQQFALLGCLIPVPNLLGLDTERTTIMLRALKNWLFGKPSLPTRCGANRSPRRIDLRIEMLEAREVPSASGPITHIFFGERFYGQRHW